MEHQSSSRKKDPSKRRSTPTSDALVSRSFAEQEAEEGERLSSNLQESTPPNFSILEPGGNQPLPLQPKLTISTPGDKYEQEADHVARQVVQRLQAPMVERSPHPQSVQRDTVSDQTNPLGQKSTYSLSVGGELTPQPTRSPMQPLADQLQQTDPAEPDHELQREVDGVKQSDPGSGAATLELERTIHQQQGRGQPLANSVRQPIEQAFGNVDFRDVRIHTDDQSDDLNRSIQAKAFTTGSDIFFKKGEYKPGSSTGQELLAHELTHVVQQTGPTVQRVSQQPEKITIRHQERQTIDSIQRKVGKIEKSLIRKSNTVHWYDWTKQGFTKSDRTVQKGTDLQEARPTIYKDFAWVITADAQQGYLRKENLSVKTWGPEKNPNYEDKNYLDQTGLLTPVGGQKQARTYKETNREWYLDQAVLMEAFRSLQGKDPETQKQLALAMLQSFAKTAAPNVLDPSTAPKGIQSTPLNDEEGAYHRSSSQNKLLDKLRQLVAKDINLPEETLQVLNDPSFMEVMAREFPVFQSDQTPDLKVNTEIDSTSTFMDSLDDLISNIMGGHKPKNSFVFNITQFYEAQNCEPKDIQAKVTRPLEQILVHRVSAQLKYTPNLKDDLITSLLDYIQFGILTKVKGVDTLIVPQLFKPLSDQEKQLFQDDELYQEVNKERTRTHDGTPQKYHPRDIFMQSGAHDSQKLSSAMIESGARLDPIAAKEAMLKFASPEQLLASSGIKVAELATHGAKTPTVCKDIKAFIGTSTFIKFRQLSKEKSAPPYQQIYPVATADLVAGLAEVNQDKGGVDQIFTDKQIPDVLQIAYYRMMNAMAGAINYKGDLIQFMNNIELIHDQLQMILAIAEPHKSGSTFDEAIKGYMKSTPQGEAPTLPNGLDATVHHKASAMHSIASVLSSVENQKEQEKGTRSLNALVLKDNYYEAHGAIASSQTYDVSVLDGYKLGNNDLDQNAYENGKKPKGPLDIYICDFHHNISVERSEYRVENITHQVDELFDKGLVADKFTVAIDCTVDFIRSDDIRKFLEHNKNRITGGDLNVVLYRSAQKFDMLGMDNYYGGFTVTINNSTSYQIFNERINQAEDQESGLSHQGMSHLAKFAAQHLDQYRALIMANTAKLYEGLPAACKKSTSSLYVAHTEDPRNVFLDIQFPGRSEAFAMGDFYLHFIKWAMSENLAFTTRPSFGFATTNFTTIAGSKVRLNPGLESEAAINKYIGYFTKIEKLLGDTDRKQTSEIQKLKDDTAKQTYLDQIGKETLQTWSVQDTKRPSTPDTRPTISAPTGVENTVVKTIKGVKKVSQPSELETLPNAAPLVYKNPGANPVLYYQANNSGGFNLQVTSGNPGSGWTQVEQFCAYLATYWLTHGHGANGLRFSDLDISTRQDAVNTLVNWGSVGGLNAQVNYARQHLGGSSIPKNTVTQKVNQGSYPQGTKIWFGNNQHAEAAVVLPDMSYLVYNPNTGNAQVMTAGAFANYIASKNTFVAV